MHICEFCNSSNMMSIYKVYSKVSNKTVDYYQCNDCKSLKQIPYPQKKEIEDYYLNYFQIKQDMNPGYLNKERYKILKKERDKTFREINFNISNIINKTNVEVGCANGLFLEYLYEKGGRNITGIDISESLLSEIDSKFRTINGSLSNIDSNYVDNLFLFNVIEHMENIDFIFKEIVRVTKENSSIIIELPIRGFISYLFKDKWRFLMADEHLNIPSLKGLKSILKKNSFEIISFTRFGSGFTTGSVNKIIKIILDKLAKIFKFGDRITLHIKRKI